MSHKESFVIANMVKVEDTSTNSKETEGDFKFFQSDIKLEAEEEILMDIKQEEIDIKDEDPTTFNFQSNGNQDVDDSVSSKDFQKSNKKREGTEGDFKYIESNIKLEIEDEISLNIKQEEIDIKDEVPSTSTFQSNGDHDADDNIPSVSFQKPNKKFKTHREKLFVCKVCDCKCAYKTNLAIHMRTHTGEKPFACSLCNYKSAQKNNLTLHMRCHKGEKPFVCSLCDYKSVQKINLIRHIRSHTGEKPFVCSLCDYKSAQKFDLTKHMRSHTGEKPFACSLCDYKSARKDVLQIHMTSHTGERPFACGLCDFKSAQKTQLTIHMRTHTGEKPFSCVLCDYKSARKQDLVRHNMNRHVKHR